MNKTISNIFCNILYQILNMIIPLITAPYISRIMKPEGVGIYSYSTSLASYFAVFMLLGIANYGSRTIAMNINKGKQEVSRNFWEMYTVQLVSSLLVLSCYVGYIICFEMQYKSALLAQIFYLFSVMIDISWYFTGTGQFKITVTRGLILKILQTISIFLFVRKVDDIIIYILIMTIGTFGGNFALWPILLKQISFSKVYIKNVRKHIRPNLVLFLPLLASSVFVYMDKIMLQAITDTVSNVGWYEYAEKIVRIPLTIITAIGTVMMPKITSVMAYEGEKASEKYINISMRYIALLSSALCFGIVAVGPELSVVYLGEPFRPCGTLMRVLSVIILFSSFANIIRTQYLIPAGKNKEYAFSIIAGAMMNLLLNIILIPQFGAMGAVVGTIGAEMTVCLGHIWSVRYELPFKVYINEWCQFIICGLVMCLLVKCIGACIDDVRVKLIVEILSGVFIYCVCGVLLLAIKKDNLLKKRKKRYD